MPNDDIREMQPHRLRCEYATNPKGIDTKEPRFSWNIHSLRRATVQSAYQILVSSSKDGLGSEDGDMWDSGRVRSNAMTHIVYEGGRLLSGRHYYWKVRVWDGQGRPGPFSRAASFSMGLLCPGDWEGEWIGAGEGVSAPLFRKTFCVKRKVSRASLHICGLGYYELYLNGQKVGDHVLDPNWTDYDDREMRGLLYPYEDDSSKRAMYVTYDVTGLLVPRENAVGVMLGNGWHNQRERVVEGKLWYGPPRLIFQMNIHYDDGSAESVVSSGAWKTSGGPIVFNNIFYGEIYDARLEQAGWNTAGFDDRLWEKAVIRKKPSGKLASQISPADKVKAALKPVMRSEPKPGVFVFDMGQNITGWARIRVRGRRGTKIKMRFAEETGPDGMPDFLSTKGTESSGQIQKDVYILKGGGPETYEPRFTWHGFRYVEITGWPGTPEIKDIEGCFVHSDVAEAGVFECSDPLVNRIYDIYVRSQLGNLHGGVPSDCPHIERLGYTGDGHITARAAMYCFDMALFYTKWIQDIGGAQHKQTGFVPHTAPFGGGGGGPAWGCAYILIPWYMYLYYGDKRILGRHYHKMAQWIGYLESRTDGGHIVEKEEPGAWCLGDWGTPDKIMVPERLVNTFYYAEVTRIMADAAGVLGRKKDSERYKKLYGGIVNAFHREFANSKSGGYSIGRQGADVFALAMGGMPEKAKKQTLINLLEHIAGLGYHLDTGILATPLLFEVLTENKMQDTAYAIIKQKTYPGYGYMIENGATTLWEFWDGQRSHNHPMFGSVVAWFFSAIGGIRTDPDKPGFENVIIRPAALCGLSSAGASYRSIRGRVSVRWEKKEGCFKLRAAIPANTTACIHMPCMGRDEMRITETNRTVWHKGRPSEPAGDISGAEKIDDEIIFRVGSGSYEFIQTWQPG